MSNPVDPVPDGTNSLTTYLTIRDAPSAIDFYTRAFEVEEQLRLPGPDGRLLHACLRIGDSALMMSEELAP